MLDIQFIREHADIVKESQRKRGESVELVDEVLRSDETRRSALKEFEEARAQQKEIGKKVAAAPADEKAALIAQTKELSAKVAEYKAAADAAAGEYTTAMWKLSNVVEPEAPEGGEDDYVVVKKVGQPRDFAAEGFEPKDHLTLGTGVAGIDMRRGVKVGGSRFYFLRGAVARMQIAHADHGRRSGREARLRARHHPDAGASRGHGRHRLPQLPRRRDLPSSRA